MDDDAKVVVFGLDGATWDVLMPWVRQGMLPTLKKLIGGGVHGTLETTIPPVTGSAWASFATGKNPGKHGCYNFILPKKSLNAMKPITSRDIKGETFYELLDNNKKKCILINLPVSYPPRIGGTVITSLMTPGDDFIFPPGLADEIPELREYRIIPDTSLFLDDKEAQYVNDIRGLEKNRFICAKKLYRREWDFFFMLFSGTDWVQHQMYDKLISEKSGDESHSMRFYQEIDEYIGWFVDNAAEKTNILLMSDHGFRAYDKAFFVNSWLKDEGYLRLEPRTKQKIPEHRFSADQGGKRHKKIDIGLPIFLLNNLKILSFLSAGYNRVKAILPFEIHLKGIQPNLSKTTAFNASYDIVGGIYINDENRFVDGIVKAENYDELRCGIMDKLKGLRNPKTGESTIKRIYKKEDIYRGEQAHLAPDVIFTLSDENMCVSASLYSDKAFDEIKSNTHSLNGIFLAYGQDIIKGADINDAKIIDLAPTLLHMFGMPIPGDMDGRVLKSMFKQGSKLHDEPTICQKDDERERIRQSIRKIKSFDIS